jgi:hypothetical protein
VYKSSSSRLPYYIRVVVVRILKVVRILVIVRVIVIRVRVV